MASYVFARICDERHHTYEHALEDIAGLVEAERYYTQANSYTTSRDLTGDLTAAVTRADGSRFG